MKTPAWIIWLHIPLIAAAQWYEEWQDKCRSRTIDRSVRIARADGARKDLQPLSVALECVIMAGLQIVAILALLRMFQIATGRG